MQAGSSPRLLRAASRWDRGIVTEPANPYSVAPPSDSQKEEWMAAAKKKTARGRKQDRARVAGGQKHEVGYEAKKTGRSASAVKKVGNSRKRVEKRLGR
jgi:hypothetical protein